MAGVILDATAAADPVYDVLGDRVRIWPRPEAIRKYDNVKLHVSVGNRVGKVHLTNTGLKFWNDLRKQLASDLARSSEVLICTHVDIRDGLQKLGVPGTNMHVAHWGAIDGKNEWQQCDAVVVYGLPYLDDIAPTDTYLAINGQQSIDWFVSSGAEARRKLKDGFIARSVVQAINRARCRRTHGIGHVQPTDVYIFLPNGRTADALMAAVCQQMPGIVVHDWPIAPLKSKRAVKSEESLIELLKRLGPGRYGKSEVLSKLDITTRTFERLSRKLQTSASNLSKRLDAINVQYWCQVGSRAEACFIKH